MAWFRRAAEVSVEVSTRSPVIEDLAAILRFGSLTKIDLDRAGISEMGAVYLGKRFEISWYHNGRLRSIVLGGDRMFSTSADADYLLSVAIERGEAIFGERIKALEIERSAKSR